MAFLAGASCARQVAPGPASACANGQREDVVMVSCADCSDVLFGSINQVTSTAGVAVGPDEEGLLSENFEKNTSQTTGVFQPFGEDPTAGTGSGRSGEHCYASTGTSLEDFCPAAGGISSDGHATSGMGKDSDCTSGSHLGGAEVSAQPSALPPLLGSDAPASLQPHLEASEVLVGNLHLAGAREVAVSATLPLDIVHDTIAELCSCDRVREEDGWVSIDTVVTTVGQRYQPFRSSKTLITSSNLES